MYKNKTLNIKIYDFNNRIFNNFLKFLSNV